MEVPQLIGQILFLSASVVLGLVIHRVVRLEITLSCLVAGVLSGLMLPLAYLAFVKLQRSRAYLGDDMPRGGRGVLWMGALVLSTLIVTAFLVWYGVTEGPGFVSRLF